MKAVVVLVLFLNLNYLAEGGTSKNAAKRKEKRLKQGGLPSPPPPRLPPTKNKNPTKNPTMYPTKLPTAAPTKVPTAAPLAVGIATRQHWTTVPGLRHGRAAHASKLFNGSIYVTGGVGDDGATPTGSVEVRHADDLTRITKSAGTATNNAGCVGPAMWVGTSTVSCPWRPAKPLLAPVFGHQLAQ